MIMVGHSERLSERLRWGAREKAAVGAVVACLVLALVGLGLYTVLAPSRGGAHEGCVDVTFASTLGAAKLHLCGQRARHACSSIGNTPSLAGALEAQCRAAGYPVGGRAAAPRS